MEVASSLCRVNTSAAPVAPMSSVASPPSSVSTATSDGRRRDATGRGSGCAGPRPSGRCGTRRIFSGRHCTPRSPGAGCDAEAGGRRGEREWWAVVERRRRRGDERPGRCGPSRRRRRGHRGVVRRRATPPRRRPGVEPMCGELASTGARLAAGHPPRVWRRNACAPPGRARRTAGTTCTTRSVGAPVPPYIRCCG